MEKNMEMKWKLGLYRGAICESKFRVKGPLDRI